MEEFYPRPETDLFGGSIVPVVLILIGLAVLWFAVTIAVLA